MRTAQDILFEQFNPDQQDCQSQREDLRIAIVLNPSLELIEKAINEARIEAIKEAAEVATVTQDYLPDDNPPYYYVNKQSILNLVNQIK